MKSSWKPSTSSTSAREATIDKEEDEEIKASSGRDFVTPLPRNECRKMKQDEESTLGESWGCVLQIHLSSLCLWAFGCLKPWNDAF